MRHRTGGQSHCSISQRSPPCLDFCRTATIRSQHADWTDVRGNFYKVHLGKHRIHQNEVSQTIVHLGISINEYAVKNLFGDVRVERPIFQPSCPSLQRTFLSSRGRSLCRSVNIGCLGSSNNFIVHERVP